MKKLKFLFFPSILALAFGLMLSCAPVDHTHDQDSSSSTTTSGTTTTDNSTTTDNTTTITDTSTSSAITLSGKIQKGPYVQGTEITVRELDRSMIPTGNTFTGTIDDHTGSFSIKGTLTNKIVELSADGYYFNEVSGSLSTAKLTLSALSNITDNSSVNVNLMTHLEKKRVEYLIDSGLTFAAAKTQAQGEILKMFNIDNVTLGNSETLDISKSGDGNAVLLAISAILQSDKTEAELTELLSTINTDIRTDGTLDSTNTKATLVTASDYLHNFHSAIRSNIENRYSNLGISATIPSFESYAFKLSTIEFCSTCLYATVGSSGTILTSSDGTSWISRTSGTTQTLEGITYGNSTLVAVGHNGTILTSSDGTSWTSRTTGTSNKPKGATYGNSTFVVVGGTPGIEIIFTSSDGTSWTSRTSGASKELSSVIYGNGLFVIVGYDGTILTSSDGTSWTSRTSGTTHTLEGITYGNSIFVASGASGTILTSSDGTSWTSRTSGTTRGLHGSTYGNSTFMAVGDYGTILTSSNGTSWTSRTSETSSHLYGVTYGNSIFVAVGNENGTGTIHTSSDGINWTSRTSGTTNSLYGVTSR